MGWAPGLGSVVLVPGPRSMAYINGLSMEVILTTKKPWDDMAPRNCKLGGSRLREKVHP